MFGTWWRLPAEPDSWGSYVSAKSELLSGAKAEYRLGKLKISNYGLIVMIVGDIRCNLSPLRDKNNTPIE